MPDVSGIDKIFDYIVPESLVARVHVGVRVRVNLNGRRVPGWIVAITSEKDAVLTVPLERLSPLVSVSGHGVEPDIVPLTQWMAQEFFGSWRAALSRASAPTVRSTTIHPRHGRLNEVSDDVVTVAAQRVLATGGGLLVVPPSAGVLSAIANMAQHGSVLVACPTHNMAMLGAASLRRRGLTTAVIPEEWHVARAGVDVVLGARSAVLAPCAQLSAIVVIDEHDELHHEERSPAWNTVSVARERAHRAQVPLLLTSALPTAESTVRDAQNTELLEDESLWPRIVIENLDDVPVAGSLLSSELLQSISRDSDTTVCVLNTKGKARLLVCKSCRAVQSCADCGSLLTQDDNGLLSCSRCAVEVGSVCVSCGRTSFVVPRGGVSQLVSQLQKSTKKHIVEVTAESDNSWVKGSVFVGTEAALFRVPAAETVVFADIDRDLSAPRVTAPREVAALILRACRLVGPRGTVVIHTRTPQHALLAALSSATPSRALSEWNHNDVAQRRAFMLPPFSSMAMVSLSDNQQLTDVDMPQDVSAARVGDALLVRATTREILTDALNDLRQKFGTRLRVHADPTRY